MKVMIRQLKKTTNNVFMKIKYRLGVFWRTTLLKVKQNWKIILFSLLAPFCFIILITLLDQIPVIHAFFEKVDNFFYPIDWYNMNAGIEMKCMWWMTNNFPFGCVPK